MTPIRGMLSLESIFPKIRLYYLFFGNFFLKKSSWKNNKIGAKCFAQGSQRAKATPQMSTAAVRSFFAGE